MSGGFVARGGGGRKSLKFSSFSPLPQLHVQKTHDIRWQDRAVILVGSTKNQSCTNLEESSSPCLEGNSRDTFPLLSFPQNLRFFSQLFQTITSKNRTFFFSVCGVVFLSLLPSLRAET